MTASQQLQSAQLENAQNEMTPEVKTPCGCGNKYEPAIIEKTVSMISAFCIGVILIGGAVKSIKYLIGK